MIAEKKRIAAVSAAKTDAPLRRKLADFAQKFIDKRTWPSTTAAGGAEEKPVIIGAKQFKQPFKIKPEGVMPYQVATVETTLAEDKCVQGCEIMPTAHEVVHHVIVNVHEKGARIRGTGDEGIGGNWAAYVPGNSSRIYPNGFARKLPAGATISFQIHYTPTGKATKDQFRMGLVVAKEPPRFAMHTAAVANPKISIPPGEVNHTVIAQKPVPCAMNVTAFMAHMHVRGKAFRFEVVTADGKTETLLDIPLRLQLAAPLRTEGTAHAPARQPGESHRRV